MTSSVTFIGGGNMTAALLGGVEKHPDFKAHVAEPNAERRAWLTAEFPNVAVYADNGRACAAAELVVLATKPQILGAVCRELATAELTVTRGFVSIAAGVPLAKLSEWLGPVAGLARAMPNQPALVGHGLTALTAAAGLPTATKAHIDAIFAASGTALWLDDETLMDTVTAISGSGPAYFYRIMEILISKAEEAGFDADAARTLVVATARGAAASAAATDLPLSELGASVTSPGGTTAAALDVLARADIHAIFRRAVDAAITRGQQLASESND